MINVNTTLVTTLLLCFQPTTALRSRRRCPMQIIVFPEYGVTGDGTTDGAELTRAGADTLSEAVPDPGGAVTPCDAPDGSTVHPATSKLSCMARTSAVVLVADLLDRQTCESPGDRSCKDGKFLFNTAVAFDPDGRLIAKYHKRHLFGGEVRTLDPGAQLAGARFNTSFGVEFGLFICFDLLFINGSVPPSDVAFPTDWVNFDRGGLPVERAVDAQRIWSGLHHRNLLASNYGGALGLGLAFEFEHVPRATSVLRATNPPDTHSLAAHHRRPGTTQNTRHPKTRARTPTRATRSSLWSSVVRTVLMLPSLRHPRDCPTPGFGRNSSGSGIWESGRKLAEFFNPTASPANKLLIADVESPQ